ncbi:MAG: hypothetical protein CSA62_00090 [Planctomycetota bacterium]|nr:MAG: hypothetical protein CSA62_00090 [Planctomycetota bacterium]
MSASSDASEADARDDADASASEADAREDGETSEAAPETTLASETTAAAEEPAAPSFDADQQKVADAWAIVFDSSTGFDDKAAHIEDADQLQSSIETFGTTGTTMGGIALKPTGVDITDDAATVTFDVIFAGTPVHSGLTGQMSLVDGTWQVSHTEFCGIMTQAQIPCE